MQNITFIRGHFCSIGTTRCATHNNWSTSRQLHTTSNVMIPCIFFRGVNNPHIVIRRCRRIAEGNDIKIILLDSSVHFPLLGFLCWRFRRLRLRYCMDGILRFRRPHRTCHLCILCLFCHVCHNCLVQLLGFEENLTALFFIGLCRITANILRWIVHHYMREGVPPRRHIRQQRKVPQGVNILFGRVGPPLLLGSSVRFYILTANTQNLQNICLLESPLNHIHLTILGLSFCQGPIHIFTF
mmetsp:Transcript_24024/g.39341  ORF Transcript_24024/g.39341 Transcript_24024/m.39341 type:complete len:241 (+) Transcript_24024:316-1038(+)